MSSPPSGSLPSDRDLVRLMAAGNASAVGLLYDRHGRLAYALARRIVGDAAEAEEVVMEAFAQVWRDAARFEEGRGSPGAWIAMITRSRALDHVRARGRRQRAATMAALDEADGSRAIGASSDDPGAAVDADERRTKVAAALALLSPVQRQAIELAYCGGLSQSQIAERLREPLGTIKTRMRLGLQKLREALRPYITEPPP